MTDTTEAVAVVLSEQEQTVLNWLRGGSPNGPCQQAAIIIDRLLRALTEAEERIADEKRQATDFATRLYAMEAEANSNRHRAEAAESALALANDRIAAGKTVVERLLSFTPHEPTCAKGHDGLNWHDCNCGRDQVAQPVVDWLASPDSQGQAVPEGWQAVPKVPTEAMIEAGWIDKEDVNPDDIYRAMLAAAPTPPADSKAEG